MNVKMKLIGLPPGMLMHRFGDAEAVQATSGAGRVAAPQDETKPRDQAARCLYTTQDETKPIIPPTWFLGSWQAAGRDYKIGKRQVSTSKSSMIPAAFTIMDEALIITPGTWEVDTRPVVIPSTGGRILRHRPRFEGGWSVSLTLDVDVSIISMTMAREIVDAAGKRIGIGDFRPQRSGPFGRYRVDSWVEGKNKK